VARTQNRSRVVPEPEPLKRRLDDEDVAAPPVKILRASRGARSARIHEPERYYGFAARVEGPRHGPWYVVFECTGWVWMNMAIQFLPNDGGDRLLTFLDEREFEDAWDEQTVGQRVVMRHIYRDFVELLNDENNRPPLALVEVMLDEEDVEERHGLQEPLTAGQWYGVEVLARADAEPTVEDGMISLQNDVTHELRAPQACTIVRLIELRALPEPPRAFVFEPYQSQAVLQALHSRRAE
jgi:hypothetical protein